MYLLDIGLWALAIGLPVYKSLYSTRLLYAVPIEFDCHPGLTRETVLH